MKNSMGIRQYSDATIFQYSCTAYIDFDGDTQLSTGFNNLYTLLKSQETNCCRNMVWNFIPVNLV